MAEICKKSAPNHKINSKSVADSSYYLASFPFLQVCLFFACIYKLHQRRKGMEKWSCNKPVVSVHNVFDFEQEKLLSLRQNCKSEDNTLNVLP